MRRRGIVYILVMGSSLTVMVIGLAALMAVRVERRAIQTGSDFMLARAYAHSAIEMGFYWMRSDTAWRTNRPTTGAWVTNQIIGDGTFTLVVTDPEDDDISLAPNNFVVLTATALKGDAKYILQMKLQDVNGLITEVPGSWTQIVN